MAEMFAENTAIRKAITKNFYVVNYLDSKDLGGFSFI